MQTDEHQPTSRYVSVREFCQRSSLSRTTLHTLVKRGELIRPHRLTPKRVGWPVEVVDAWLASRANPDQVTA